MSEQQSPSFCRMPPDSFFAGRSAKGASPVLCKSSAIRQSRSDARLPEHAAEELDVFADAEVGVEVFSQPLRHIGDAGTNGGTVRGVAMSPSSTVTRPDCTFARPDDAEQRRFADAVGADQPDHATGRQRRSLTSSSATTRPITLSDIFEARDGHDRPVHCVAVACSRSGQGVAGSVKT